MSLASPLCRPRVSSLGAGAAALAAALLAALRRPVPASGPRRGAATSALAVGSCCGARLALARREFVVLSGARDQTLVCESGELWVTLEGDSTDHILRCGQRLAIPARASAFVNAAATSVLRVNASAREQAGFTAASSPRWAWQALP